MGEAGPQAALVWAIPGVVWLTNVGPPMGPIFLGPPRKGAKEKIMKRFLIFVVLALVMSACGLLPKDAPAAPTPTPIDVGEIAQIAADAAVEAIKTEQAANVPTTPTATDTPVPVTVTPTVAPPTAAPQQTPVPQAGLPEGLNLAVFPNANGEYVYDPSIYESWDIVCEGTQKETGDLHLIWVNPPHGIWQRFSCYAYPHVDEGKQKQLAVQFAGDKVRNWESAGVEPLPIRIMREGSEVLMDLNPGEVPDAYSLVYAGADLSAPMKLHIQGIAQLDSSFIASVGAVDEWTYLEWVSPDGKTHSEAFYGVRESVPYKEVIQAWRLPGSWDESQAKAFTP